MNWWKKKPLIDVINAYEAFSNREQKIVLSTLIVALLMVGYLFVIEPIAIANSEIADSEKKLIKSNSSLSQQIDNTRNNKVQDPNIMLRDELHGLLKKSDDLQNKINSLTKALVAPRQMVSLLEKVLIQDKQLKLISLKNLPEEAMSMAGMEGEELIYRHVFEIELEATYDSALAYLKRLDDLPWQLFWQELEYESTEYPKGKLNIQIYTLSMSREVLGV